MFNIFCNFEPKVNNKMFQPTVLVRKFMEMGDWLGVSCEVCALACG